MTMARNPRLSVEYYGGGGQEGTRLTPETFQQLKETEWGSVGQELLAFTIQRVQNYKWGTYSWQELPKGRTPEDIVHHIIEKTLTGERHWDPQKGPLVPWLKDQVKSVVDAVCHSATRRREIPTPTDADEDSDDLRSSQRLALDNFPSPTEVNPENILLEKEEAEWEAKKINALFAAVSGQPELQQILSVIMDGCEPKPRYIAAEIGVSESEVNNRLKRIRRHALKLEKELEHAK
jgi:DNA-directed RNA polymerase specialized sigma24 family protein